MNRTLLVVVVAYMAAITHAQNDKEFPLDDFDYSDSDSEAADSRFLLAYTNTTSVTIGYNSFALGIAASLALLGLLALAMVYAAGDEGSSYGYSGYADYSSGYSRKSYVHSYPAVIIYTHT